MLPIMKNHFFDSKFKNPMYPPSFNHGLSLFVFFSSCKRNDFAGCGVMRPIAIIQDRFNQQDSCISVIKKPLSSLSISKEKKSTNDRNRNENTKVPRIAIIGGGICGVTAAKSIAARMSTSGQKKQVDITIYEADVNSLKDEGNNLSNELKQPGSCFMQPQWKAATARNANSLGENSSISFL